MNADTQETVGGKFQVVLNLRPTGRTFYASQKSHKFFGQFQRIFPKFRPAGRTFCNKRRIFCSEIFQKSKFLEIFRKNVGQLAKLLLFRSLMSEYYQSLLLTWYFIET